MRQETRSFIKEALRGHALLPLFALALSLTGCQGNEQFPPVSHYYKSAKKIEIQVFYETGAEPFTLSVNQGFKYWSILEQNIEALMQYRTEPPEIVVPKELKDMNAMVPFEKSTWTSDEILAILGSAMKLVELEEETNYFYVFFLHGYIKNEGEVKKNILGANVRGLPVVAVFKDVVDEVGTFQSATAKYVEQSTLVHELGHAFGLVNNGVPLATRHQDEGHGAHTIDEDSVMYYLNEGRSDARDFIENFLDSQSVVLWGRTVLQDVEAFSS